MKKNIIIVLLIVLLVWVYFKYLKKPKTVIVDNAYNANSFSSNSTALTPQQIYNSLPVGQLPLEKGDKNRLVFLLQMALNKLHNEGLSLDGDFGSNTENALLQNYKTKIAGVNTARLILINLQKSGVQDQATTFLMKNFKS